MIAPTGTQFALRVGAHEAVVTEVGGSVRRYRVGERDVLMPYDVAELPPAVHGAVLLPWPNRLRDGAYTFDGEHYQLPLTEPERGNAHHGLVLHTRWRPVAHTTEHVRLALDLVPRPGYPFELHSEIEYRLDGDGLTVRLRTGNTGATTAPYGVGFHPWLSPGRHRLDDCLLEIEADGWVRTDDRLLPIAETDVPAELDYRVPRRLDAARIDDAFVRLHRPSRVSLTDPDGVRVSCLAQEGVACWQVYTGDALPGPRHRGGLAAEPMSCTADALRTGNRLIRLRPGQEHTIGYRVQVQDQG